MGAFEQLFGPGWGGGGRIWTNIFQQYKCPWRGEGEVEASIWLVHMWSVQVISGLDIIYVARIFNKKFYKRVIIHVVCMYVCCPASRLMSWMISAYNVEQEALLGFNFGLMIHTTLHIMIHKTIQMISFKKIFIKSIDNTVDTVHKFSVISDLT